MPTLNIFDSIERRLLFFPDKYPIGNWTPPLGFEDVWIERKGGGHLHAWYLERSDCNKTLVYFHGNGGHLADRRATLLMLQSALKVSLLIFDYSGYGRSDGRPNGDQIMADGESVHDWLVTRYNNAILKQRHSSGEQTNPRIILLGRSLGGAVATHVARNRKVDTLILECTFKSLPAVAKEHYPWLPAKKLVRNNMNSIENIKYFEGQLILSHGGQDETIPFSHGEQLFEAANEPKTFLPFSELGHNDPMPVEYYIKLQELLGQV